MQNLNRVSVAGVDTASIIGKSYFSSGVELLSRKRPPGEVNLTGGHIEHLLMCTRGRKLDKLEPHSVLRTEEGVLEWNSCPNWHITFVPAGYPLQWLWSYESESLHLAMKPTFLNRVSEQISETMSLNHVIRPVFRTANPILSDLLHQLQRESSQKSIGSSLAIDSLLNIIAIELYRLFGTQPERHKQGSLSQVITNRCTQLMKDRLDENISLIELAQESGLSSFHFLRKFKNATGYPPHEYHLRLRVERGKELLVAQKGKTIAEISYELGFADESHFRRHFKRIIGKTPSQFRRQ